MTKLQRILNERGMSQVNLYSLIKEKCNTPIGLDRISNIASGKLKNYNVNTLLKLCIALDCTPNDIVERDYFMHTELKPNILENN